MQTKFENASFHGGKLQHLQNPNQNHNSHGGKFQHSQNLGNPWHKKCTNQMCYW